MSTPHSPRRAVPHMCAVPRVCTALSFPHDEQGSLCFPCASSRKLLVSGLGLNGSPKCCQFPQLIQFTGEEGDYATHLEPL